MKIQRSANINTCITHCSNLATAAQSLSNKLTKANGFLSDTDFKVKEVDANLETELSAIDAAHEKLHTLLRNL